MTENSQSKVITVGTTLVVISDEIVNQERVLIRLTNTSPGAQVISLGFEGEAIDGAGVVLQPGGFHMESKDSLEFNIVTQKRITAISDLASGTLAVYERVM